MKTRIMPLVSVILLLSAVICLADEAEDQFNFATGLMIKNEHELAAEEFKALLQKHPAFQSADVACFRLGETMQKLKKPAEAKEAFLKVITDYPKSEKLPQAYYRLGELSSEKEHKEAAKYFAMVAEKWPDNALAEAALYWSAEELFKAEDWENAAKAYAAASVKFPAGKFAAPSLYSLGWSEFQRGRFDAAALSFKDFLAKYSTHELAPECRVKLGEALTKTKKYDEAAAVYAQAKGAAGKIGQEAAIGAAWCMYEQGKFADAAVAFSEAATLLGKDPRAATCIFNAGNAQVENKDYAKAIAEFAKMPVEFPNHELASDAAYWQGYCLVRIGKLDEAVTVLEALKTSGKSGQKEPELLHSLAEAKFGQKKYQEAAAVYADLAKRFPKHRLAPAAAYGRMLAVEKTGDLGAAEAAGKEFFASFAESDTAPLARFAIGEYRFRLKKYKEAADDFAKFLAGAGAAELAADAEYKLGWCELNLKNHAAALARFSNVVTKYPKSPLAAESAYLAGRAAEDGGDKAAARQRYEECMKGYPDAEYAQRSDLALMLMDFGAKKYADSVARADAFLKKAPDSALADYAKVYRGEALLELGRPEDALAAYQAVKPGNEAGPGGDGAYGIAWANRKMGKHAEAADAFFKVASMKSPKAEDAEFWGCRSLEDAGKFADASQRFEKFVAAHSASSWSAEAAYRQALCTFKEKRLDDAEKLYLAYLNARKKSDFAANALYDLAWVYKEKNKPEEASKRLEQLLAEYPKSELAADVKFRLGETAQDAKDYKKAAARYEEVLAGGNVAFGDKVLYKLGWCYDYQEQTAKAAEAFLRICREFPRSELVEESHYRAGKLLQKEGKYDEAFKEYAAIGAGDFAERAQFQTAESLRLAGKHKEALAAYDAVLAKFPKTEFLIQVNLGRGDCMRSLGSFADAIVAYDSVVKATDTIDAASAVLGIGYSQFAKAEFKEAAKTFLKVDILYGYDEIKPEALSMVAESWQKAGDAEKAKKYRDELVQRYPGSKFAKQN